jgi:RNA polymerase sigma-70 factor (ECF subfamily)
LGFGTAGWEDRMRAALAGDQTTYRRLLGDLAPVIRGIVARSLARSGRGNAEVEDIVQDVLLSVHLKRHTWDPGLPLLPWLNAVTRHKVIDALRRRGAAPQVPIEDVEHALAAPERVAGDGRDAARLLAELPERQRRIVQGVVLQERAAADVGRDLGMSEGAVRVALHRALKKLARVHGGGAT